MNTRVSAFALSTEAMRIDFLLEICHNHRRIDFRYMKLTRFLSLALGLTLGVATATADETLYTGAFWTEGVSETGGWYDANKLDNSDGDADDYMCYAASAANVIAWWQDSTVGSTLTSEAPKQLSDIWQTMINANERWEEGGESLGVVNWWVSGIYCPEDKEDTDAWARFYLLTEDFDDDELIPVTLSPTNGYYFDQYGLTQEKLSDFLVDLQMYTETMTGINFGEILNRGNAITLSIVPEEDEEAGHAITLWGVEYDEEGTLTTMWITDSDDGAEKLVKISVRVDKENDKIWLGEEYDKEYHYYLTGVYAIDARESFKWSELSMSTYIDLQVNPTTHNGRAGAALLPEVFMNEEPAEGGALEAIIEAVDDGEMNDRAAAAVAGASTAVLGLALSSDVERQLRAIRNRAVSGNYSQDAVLLDDKSGCIEQPGKYFAWINAEGNRSEQNNDATAAGYTLNSWGGTVGAGMQVNKQFTLGLAITAMRGDLKSDAPDSLDGDMDTTYLSAFARYQSSKWSHNFIGTVSTMEADYNRFAMGYRNDGETEGAAIGLMYELSRDYTLGSTSSVSPLFNISYRHTEVDSFSESGTDAALNVGKQSLDTVTVGLGARYAAMVGQQTLNRHCAIEARVLAKGDLGDTQTDTRTGFIGHESRAHIESTEMGRFGIELGAGISVPVGSGSIFADGAVELRNDYTNLNAAAGYRIQF